MVNVLPLRKLGILVLHALFGWGICGMIIAIGRNTTSMENTLFIHAIAVPIVFGTLSWVYFSKFNHWAPLPAASIFLIVPLALDAGIVAPFAEKSYVMFGSLLGTWIPFALIFGSTFLVGVIVNQRGRTRLNTGEV